MYSGVLCTDDDAAAAERLLRTEEEVGGCDAGENMFVYALGLYLYKRIHFLSFFKVKR